MSGKAVQTSSDLDFKRKLSEEAYRVMRENGTEKPFYDNLWKETSPGNYFCQACATLLFNDSSKFTSACGWPAFTQPVHSNMQSCSSLDLIKNNDSGPISYVLDTTYGMNRVEVRCRTCNSHLGHVFDDGPSNTLRYCINSVCLNFVPKKS